MAAGCWASPPWVPTSPTRSAAPTPRSKKSVSTTPTTAATSPLKPMKFAGTPVNQSRGRKRPDFVYEFGARSIDIGWKGPIIVNVHPKPLLEATFHRLRTNPLRVLIGRYRAREAGQTCFTPCNFRPYHHRGTMVMGNDRGGHVLASSDFRLVRWLEPTLGYS